jgi:hypothetical protein
LLLLLLPLLLYFFAGVDRLDEVDDLYLYFELLRDEDLDAVEEDLYLYLELELPLYVLAFPEEKRPGDVPFAPLEYLKTFFDVPERPEYLYAVPLPGLEIPAEDFTAL